MGRAEIIAVAKKAAGAWRDTDAYHQAAQIIDILISELEEAPTLLQPSNEPLTLEEIRGMDGEPVWIDVADGVWALVDTDDDCVWLDRGGSIDICRLTGKVYRRPPEGDDMLSAKKD